MTDRTILSAINRPGRYLGHEFNSIQKSWKKAEVTFALIFPDLYEIGMSHQGLQILYHLLNKKDTFLAERCYCPDTDVEQLLRKEQAPLTSLESGHPLGEFDVLGFTLPYELCYTNILTVLDLANIPFYSKERTGSTYPLLIGGGACALNPEPIADFFDAILLGDGEEALVEIAEVIAQAKSANTTKEDLLDQLALISGVYIPGHFRISCASSAENTPVISIAHKTNPEKTVERRIVSSLDNIDHLKTPLVPNAKIVHDRLGIEVARGCTRGCRFCQAGITYRPVRERSSENVLELAKESIENSGFDELALLSLSTGDYSCLEQVLPPLMDEFAGKYVSVAMPSMRVGTLTPTIMEEVKRVRKTGFTLAPEAGSERLRRVINKGITEADLLRTCEEAFDLGWRLIKCYFMIGLPTETKEDIDAIVELIRKMLATRGSGPGKGKKQINASVGTFVPKPHTPFQWEGQLTIEESSERIHQLKRTLPKGTNLRYHNPRVSYLEGVFSRGDRRLAALIVDAWQNGARLDGWAEHFSLDVWRLAAQNCELSLDSYLRARQLDEILPWEHLQSGVHTQFLKDELEKGKAEGYTPDCRYHACQKCGLCDFDTILPVVHNRKGEMATPVRETSGSQQQKENGHYKYIVHYSRLGNICYLGHLEILQVIFRALQRANIQTNYSQGFNPSPKVSFGPALPVGTESYGEYFIMDLKAPLEDEKKAQELLNCTLAPGLQVTGIEPHCGKIPQKLKVSYEIHLPREAADSQRKAAAEFMETNSHFIEKTRKGKTREIDIRPLIAHFAFSKADVIDLQIIAESAKPSIKPSEAVANILALEETEVNLLKIVKLGWQQLD